ncbi:MAG: manganese efflux pump [Clostridia bacterium]|nr:manganese efflux pump [Clostridia bacterium]
MELWELFLLAVGLSMDAFAVSVCNAMTIDNLRKRDAAKFGLFFGLFQAGMPLIGWLCGCAFSSYVIALDHWVAFVLLSFIGGKMILEAVRGEEAECRENPLAFSVLFVLAVATSIDALAVGVTFAFMPELSVLPSVALIGVVTFVISTFGALLGKKAGSALGTKAELVGGLILIGIGVKILVEHLFFA